MCFEPCFMTDMEKHWERSDSNSLVNCSVKECKWILKLWHQKGQSCILHQRSSSYMNWRDFLRFLSLRISNMVMYDLGEGYNCEIRRASTTRKTFFKQDCVIADQYRVVLWEEA